jgi:hypothetical protein
VAKVSDYIGIQFGPFVIDSHLGGGQEAEAFLCTDRRTELVYVLKLDANDPEFWRGAPKNPPMNGAAGSIGRRTAEGTLAAHQSSLESGGLIRIPDVWGVLGDELLILVSSPVRVRHSLNIDEVLSKSFVTSIKESLNWFELSAAIADHLNSPDLDAPAFWENLSLISSTTIADYVETSLESRTVSASDRAKCLQQLRDTDVLPLERNVLLRTTVAYTHQWLTLPEFEACLFSRSYRVNVSQFEIGQVMAMHNLVGGHLAPLTMNYTSSDIYPVILNALTYRPIYENKDDDRCEPVDPPDLDEYSLFLQDEVHMANGPIVLIPQDDGSFAFSIRAKDGLDAASLPIPRP